MQHGFKTTFHAWCGLGIRDFDSGKPLGHHTRIASKKVISSHGCQCGDVSSHVHELRKDRNDVELDNGDGSPHQKANRDWAVELIEIMKLKPGGPIMNDAGGVLTEDHYEKKEERKGRNDYKRGIVNGYRRKCGKGQQRQPS